MHYTYTQHRGAHTLSVREADLAVRPKPYYTRQAVGPSVQLQQVAFHMLTIYQLDSLREHVQHLLT